MIFSVGKSTGKKLDCFDLCFKSSMVFRIHVALKFNFICFIFALRLSILFPRCLCLGSDTILNGQSLLPNQTIISNGGRFELGFFSPGNSSNYYVGIWYKNIPEQTIVWMANRNDPVNSFMYNNSRLEMSNGNLYLYVNMKVRWAVGTSNSTEAVILDTGNFILRNASGIIWQSFHYPTNTWLPGAYLGFPLLSDVEAKLVSWKNPSDPAMGDYSLGIESSTSRELFMKRNSLKLWRSGYLQGASFSSLPGSINKLYNITYVSRDGSSYFVYNNFNESLVSRIVMEYDRVLRIYVWAEARQAWIVLWAEPSDACKTYALCGPNAICDISAAPPCSCLPGFVPQVVEAWKLLNFSDGCRREKPLSCRRDSFIKLSDVRLPANNEQLGVGRFSICEFACADNCSCFAYAFSSDGGCSLFTGNLLDLERLSDNSSGRDLYIRMESDSHETRKGNRNVRILALVVSISAVTLACSIYMCYFWQKRKTKVSRGAHQNLLLLDLSSDASENNKRPADGPNNSGEEKNNKNDLPTFSFSSISAATNDFSMANKLGEGGFGPVYKGELLSGQFVAVKRLSKRSGQGLEEFKNETELIAKLQHRNLVGILGCCIENDEKILVYEYMPNKSLDFFLFDQNKKETLDWTRRVCIIEGIAQGLLYLHHYSRLRIVHRDLKASNILLDAEMKPKISDFGMARIFGGTVLQANTKRIVGTYVICRLNMPWMEFSPLSPMSSPLEY